MNKFVETIFGSKVGNTRVTKVSFKIIVVFVLIILASNLASNYINLILNRGELITQTKKMLSKDLRDIFNFSTNQYEIYRYNENLDLSINAIQNMVDSVLPSEKSIAFGIKEDGSILFQSTNREKISGFDDEALLKELIGKKDVNTVIGSLNFTINNEGFFGFYRYSDKWEAFIVLAENYDEFYKASQRIFYIISAIIIAITILSVVIGVFVLRKILRYITKISRSIMEMIKQQQLGIIDLKGAPNDEITYLGMAFNSLSNSINTLLTIFRKFVSKDIAIKAYKEMQIRLDGSEQELTILFTDIKSFTYITETLGSDIIKLLNLHYSNAINEIMKHDGIIGSIIGDALLTVFGAIEDSKYNKSYASILTAYRLQYVTASLRKEMTRKKLELEANRGRFNTAENKVYKAVLLNIGVGVDGGNVFYGNIGSTERMTNTVIGDNVNSASRLEGLTRIYNVPVICSDFVKKDIEANVKDHGIIFQELDLVRVKGKTIGQKIYWPIIKEYYKDGKVSPSELSNFTKALHLYIDGKWKEAHVLFQKSSLPPANEFVTRTKTIKVPANWKGIWDMKEK